ncbi:MAG: hypothetical protein CVU98_00830 [Firmicutes bacterium HGW-Firmicutes-3]|jgi:hypothetical protein|nr:MAG: hypothetical protein CVU98_00830 [Firmicutes bacterium HGW-Firmicutes-3]
MTETYDEYMDRCCKSLANFGWTFPKNFSPAEISDLTIRSKNRYQVDEYFLDYYSKDLNFERILHIVYSSSFLNKQYEVFEQCIKTYKSGLYLVTVPALLMVLEGVIASKGEDKCFMMLEAVQRNIDSSDSNTYKKDMWRSFYYFIKLLYETKPFNHDRPNFINRHWIMHGRDFTNCKQADCLRLFQALYTLVSAGVDMEVTQRKHQL